MSWHDPLCDWDIQYIPREKHEQEGSCAQLAYLLRQNHQCLTPQPGAQNEAVWESRPLALHEAIFGKNASPSCPGLGGAQVSQPWAAPRCSQPRPAAGQSSRVVWQSWLLLAGCGSAECLRPQL